MARIETMSRPARKNKNPTNPTQDSDNESSPPVAAVPAKKRNTKKSVDEAIAVTFDDRADVDAPYIIDMNITQGNATPIRALYDSLKTLCTGGIFRFYGESGGRFQANNMSSAGNGFSVILLDMMMERQNLSSFKYSAPDNVGEFDVRILLKDIFLATKAAKKDDGMRIWTDGSNSLLLKLTSNAGVSPVNILPNIESSPIQMIEPPIVPAETPCYVTSTIEFCARMAEFKDRCALHVKMSMLPNGMHLSGYNDDIRCAYSLTLPVVPGALDNREAPEVPEGSTFYLSKNLVQFLINLKKMSPEKSSILQFYHTPGSDVKIVFLLAGVAIVHFYIIAE